MPFHFPHRWYYLLEDTPSEKGCYLLRLSLEQAAFIKVGKLGETLFESGYYFYAGSALGRGGLRGRLRHHLSSHPKFHWHIDWVIPYMRIQGWAVETGLERKECLWSQALFRMPGAFCPLPGFGASDCRNGCISHLIGFKDGF